MLIPVTCQKGITRLSLLNATRTWKKVAEDKMTAGLTLKLWLTEDEVTH